MDIKDIKKEVLKDAEVKIKIVEIKSVFDKMNNLACILQPYFGKKTNDELYQISQKLMEFLNVVEENYINEYCLAHHAMMTVNNFREILNSKKEDNKKLESIDQTMKEVYESQNKPYDLTGGK